MLMMRAVLIYLSEFIASVTVFQINVNFSRP